MLTTPTPWPPCCYPSTLLLLLLLLLLLGVSGNLGASHTWHRVKVDQVTLSVESPTTRTLDGLVKCAAVASKDPEVDLFCVPSVEICQLYQTVMVAADNSSTSSTATECWTKHQTFCVKDGVVYYQGNIAEIDCYPHICTNGQLLLQTPLGNPCSAPFATYGNGDCLYVHQTPLEWCEARKLCYDLGGDLARGTNYNTLKEILDALPDDEVWVGVKDRRWVDGRAVLTSEWHNGNPNDPIESKSCARMQSWSSPSDHYLTDKGCNAVYKFTCQLF